MAALGEFRAEDGGVGERVAVDLRGRDGGHPAGGGVGVGGGELGVALRHVEGAGERLPGVHLGVAQRGQPGQQHVDLELGALGGGGRRAAGQLRQRPRGGADQDVPGGGGALAVGGAVGDLGGPPVGVDPYRLVAGGEHGTGRPGGGGQRVGERAHPADRHVPGAGAAADDVVQEAAVLEQGGVVGVGEGADQGVGEDHAPDQVVGEVLLDGDPHRFLEQGPPGVRVVDPAAQFLPGGQRFGERREDPPGDLAGHAVEAPPGRVLAFAAGEPGEGLPRPPLAPADQQPRRSAAPLDGRVRGDVPGAHPEVQAEVPDDLPGQQADQVGVAGQPGVDAGEGPGGHRRSAGAGQPFQDQDGASGAGQVGGGDQAVVAAADDDGVVGTGSPVRGHGSW
ncbi:hypothetical protein SFUMM280S_08810 [Streptomyces fumanus]